MIAVQRYGTRSNPGSSKADLDKVLPLGQIQLSNLA